MIKFLLFPFLIISLIPVFLLLLLVLFLLFFPLGFLLVLSPLTPIHSLHLIIHNDVKLPLYLLKLAAHSLDVVRLILDLLHQDVKHAALFLGDALLRLDDQDVLVFREPRLQIH